MCFASSAALAQQSQSALHFYELGIEAPGASRALTVELYNAFTGERYWTSVVATTDLGFDLGGPVGGGVTSGIYAGVQVVTVPAVGLYVLSFPELESLSFAIGTDPAVALGSFYRPIQRSGSADTYFKVSGATLNVSNNEVTSPASINQILGQSGWTLPYDRTTLCAAVQCSSAGPTQFISAGVQTETVPGHPTWQRLVPTFPIKGNVVIPTAWPAQNWTVPGLTLQFASSKSLTVDGSLSTSGTTLTETITGQGWGGLRFNAGSGGFIDASVIERVKAYGGTAVGIDGASPYIRNTEIRDSPCCGITGVSIQGTDANPILERNVITRMSGAGVMMYGYLQPRFIRNRITDNGSDGVVAGFNSYAFLAPEAGTGGRVGNDILRNVGVGVSASNSAYVNYSWYWHGGSGYHNDGYNEVRNNGGVGNVATSAGAIAAGNSEGQRRNSFYRNARSVTNKLDVLATGGGARAYVNCNYWGPGAVPPFRTDAVGGGVLYNASYLAEDPRVNPFAPCLPIGGSARASAADQSTPANLLATLADATSIENPAKAFEALAAVVAAGGPLVAPALAEVGWLARRPGAPAEALRLLEAYAASRNAPARTAALAALVGVHGAAGDAAGSLRAAEALVATQDPEAMLAGQTARVYILTEAGRTREATEVLAAATVLAPGSGEVAMARAHVARETGQALAALDAETATASRASRGAAAAEVADDAVGEAALGAVQPNPASRVATVPLALPQASHVRLALVDVLGREAAVLVDGPLGAGRHRLAFDAGALAPGVYVLRASVTAEGGARVLVGRVTVVR